MKLKLYYEVNGIAVDEDENPCPAGMCIDLGEIYDLTKENGEELLNKFSIDMFLNYCGLNGIIDPLDVTRISEEEYIAKYED